jgi:nuclear RNA export factor
VRPEFVDRILHLNGFTFAGAPLVVEKWDKQNSKPAPEVRPSPFEKRNSSQLPAQNGFGRQPSVDPSHTTSDTKVVLNDVLNKRYDSNLRLLNLSALTQDPNLQQLGVLSNQATRSKIFPALMKMCDGAWDTPEKKEDAVLSVTLSNNDLVTVLDVTTLAATFPKLRNLDLSNNQIADLDGLKFWRWKFRDLEHLLISNNPIDASLDLKTAMMRWYPKLLRLNDTVVRTPNEVKKQHNPIPVLAPFFQDEADIGAKFVTDFFPLFDADRITALTNFYDIHSTFSVSVNTHAKRVEQEERHNTSWDQYIKRSRNLLKITHLPARTSRLFRGAEIKTMWESMPRTKHPALNQHPSDWLVECHPLPGLPDPQGQTPGGVGGLIIMVHGNFEEMQAQTGKTIDRRSFDRTFVLGPGNGVGGIRVISDILVLRGPGGSEAWAIDPTYTNTIAATPSEPRIAHPEIPPNSLIGQNEPGKSEETLRNERLAIELSFKTSMKLQWAANALIRNDWDAARAFANFQDLVAKEKIPPEAFLDVPK